MAKLIYSGITSLDGYVADEDGNFDWSVPDEEVHTFVNDLERPVGTYLYGRRMYEVMVSWETAHTLADQPPFMQDFAEIWQAADKIVYSSSASVASPLRPPGLVLSLRSCQDVHGGQIWRAQSRASHTVAGQSRQASWDRVGDAGRAIVCCLLRRRFSAGRCYGRGSAE
jgi:RibD C-terminal domain